MYCALDRGDAAVRNLVLLTTPIDTSELAATRAGSAHDSSTSTASPSATGGPGAGDRLRQQADEAGHELLDDLPPPVGERARRQATAREAYQAMAKWVADNPPFPGRAYREWITWMYKENRLVRGRMRLRGRARRPRRGSSRTCSWSPPAPTTSRRRDGHHAAARPGRERGRHAPRPSRRAHRADGRLEGAQGDLARHRRSGSRERSDTLREGEDMSRPPRPDPTARPPTAAGREAARPRRARDRRHARHRGGDLPQPGRAGRGRRRRLQPRPRARRGVLGRARRNGVKAQHPPGQHRLGGRLPAHRRRGDRPARPAGHPRQQRRHHHRQDGPEDDRRGLVQGARRQPVGRVLHVPGGAAAHDRARHRADHQHLLDHRRDRQHRPGELRRVEVGPVRPDQDAGARGRLPAQAGRTSSTDDGDRAHRQHGRPRASSRPRCSRRVPEKVLDRIKAQIPVGRLGPARRGRPRRALPRRRRVLVHHRAVWAVNGGMDM